MDTKFFTFLAWGENERENLCAPFTNIHILYSGLNLSQYSLLLQYEIQEKLMTFMNVTLKI